MLPEREEYGRPRAKKEEPGSPWSFKVARIAGIPVRLHFTFVLLLVWIVADTIQSKGMGSIAALVLAIFLCVLLHEYGHALTARRYGIETRHITLYPIGGVASITGRPKPAAEFWIALAGPLVNVVIAIIFLGVSFLVQGRAPELSLTLNNVTLIDGIFSANVILPVFNLVPAFPMDGGRVLRAFLAMNMDENRATQIAGSIGQLLAIGVGIWALLGGQVILMLIAFFVFIGAGQEMAMSTNLSVMTGKLVYDAMQVRFRTIESGASLNTAAQMLLDGSQQDFPVVAGEEVVGILTRGAIAKGMGEAGPEAYAIEFAEREIRRVDVRESLESAIDAFADGAAPALVYDGEKLVGMLTRENLSEFVMLEHARRQGARRTGTQN